MTRVETLRLAMKSASGAQLVPPLVVFQTPPATAPSHMMLGFVGWITIERVRPPMLPGPRHFQAEVLSPAVPGGAGAGAAAAPGPNGNGSDSSRSIPALGEAPSSGAV